MTAFVLFDNVFNQAGATIAYSAELNSSGFFAHDWLLYDRWTPGTASDATIKASLTAAYSVDCWAVFGHNLGTLGASIALEYSDDDISWTTVETISPTDDKPIFSKISSISHQYYRLKITNNDAATQIYQCAIGQALQLKPLNVGFKPPFFEQFTAINNINRQGNLLGRSITRSKRKLAINQTLITAAELRTDFKPWLDHAARLPFLFCWNEETYPGETVFCWLEDDAPDPVYSQLCYMSISMEVNAMVWHEVPTT